MSLFLVDQIHVLFLKGRNIKLSSNKNKKKDNVNEQGLNTMSSDEFENEVKE